MCHKELLGKSTLLEAIAEAYGIDTRGGHGGRRYGSYLDKSPLGAALRLSRTEAGRRFTGRNAKGFFLRAETAFGMLAYMTDMGVAGYGEELSWEVSHGESYLNAVQGRFTGPGLYLLDEAEGPLSFQSTLVLLFQLQDLAQREDAQVIYSTHSPMVAAHSFGPHAGTIGPHRGPQLIGSQFGLHCGLHALGCSRRSNRVVS